MLQHADTNYIQKLAYTEETKLAVYTIVSNKFNSDMVHLISNENERHLIETLFALHSNGSGDDDLLNDKRSIAFAYGAQYNLTQAVLYAGAIELLAK